MVVIICNTCKKEFKARNRGRKYCGVPCRDKNPEWRNRRSEIIKNLWKDLNSVYNSTQYRRKLSIVQSKRKKQNSRIMKNLWEDSSSVFNSKQYRRKLSKAHKGREILWGDKISASLKGREVSGETREKIKKSLKEFSEKHPRKYKKIRRKGYERFAELYENERIEWGKKAGETTKKRYGKEHFHKCGKKGGLKSKEYFESHPRLAKKIWKEAGKKAHKLWKERDLEGYLNRQKKAGKAGGKIGGKVTHKKHPGLARKMGKKNAKILNEKYGEMKSYWGSLGAMKTLEKHPGLSSRTMKKTHKKHPDLNKRILEQRRKELPYKYRGVSFDSGAEREVCKWLVKKGWIKIPVDGKNCHVWIGDSKKKRIEVDFRITNGIFIEYHPYDKNALYKTNKVGGIEYYQIRRRVLDKNGFKSSPLIIISSLTRLSDLDHEIMYINLMKRRKIKLNTIIRKIDEKTRVKIFIYENSIVGRIERFGSSKEEGKIIRRKLSDLNLPSKKIIESKLPHWFRIGFLYIEIKNKCGFWGDIFIERCYRRKDLGSHVIEIIIPILKNRNITKIEGNLSKVDNIEKAKIFGLKAL